MTKDIYEPEPIASEADKLANFEPCDHPGCLSHVSHPCEGCGRTHKWAARMVTRCDGAGKHTHTKGKKMFDEDEDEGRGPATINISHDGMIKLSKSGQAKLYAFAEGNKWVPKSIIGYEGAKLIELPRWFAKNEGLI